jgi:hypothetical protein
LVDLNTGQLWDDPEQRHKVDTSTVRTTRTQVCSMSVRGVIPSLQAHGHASRSAVRRIGSARTTSAARRKPAARKKS